MSTVLGVRYCAYYVLCTRNTHAYDVACRSKCHAWMGRAAQVSGVARLVGVQRAVQNNGNVNIKPKYLAVKNLQYVLSTVGFFLFSSCSLGLYGGLTVLSFVRVASRRLCSALASALDSAKYYVAKTQLYCPPRPLLPKMSSQRRVMHVVSNILPGA